MSVNSKDIVVINIHQDDIDLENLQSWQVYGHRYPFSSAEKPCKPFYTLNPNESQNS